MTNRSVVVWVAVLGLLFRPLSARAEVTVGEAVADGDGGGAIQFAVDPAADPALVAEELGANLALGEGATVQSVTVENGIATIEFAGAPPGATVVATLPSEMAVALGVTGAMVAGQTTSTAAMVGGGLLAIVGGVFGGLAASGALGDDEEIPLTGLR